MPLSEDEERVLKDIERNFYESDPKFARVVETSDPYPNALRIAKAAIVGAAVFLVALLLSFTVHFVAGFVCFLGMVGCAFVAHQNFRRSNNSVSPRPGELRRRLGRRPR